jgi:uncharacterized membrane protein (UPF0127 family)
MGVRVFVQVPTRDAFREAAMRLIGLAAIGLILVSCLPDEVPAGAGEANRLTVVTGSGRHQFEIEVAATSDTQARGLMYRRKLAPDAGVLFVYPATGPLSMWMKNTYLPLDMLFIDAAGHITHIVERTVPLSTRIIRSNGPARAVLEVNGGTVDRLGIAKGDRVVHPVFVRPD